MLEQVANLQQLCLQLQTQRGPGVSELWVGRPASGQGEAEDRWDP